MKINDKTMCYTYKETKTTTTNDNRDQKPSTKRVQTTTNKCKITMKRWKTTTKRQTTTKRLHTMNETLVVASCQSGGLGSIVS